MAHFLIHRVSRVHLQVFVLPLFCVSVLRRQGVLMGLGSSLLYLHTKWQTYSFFTLRRSGVLIIYWVRNECKQPYESSWTRVNGHTEIPFEPSQVLLNQQTVASIIGYAIEDAFLAFEDDWCMIPQKIQRWFRMFFLLWTLSYVERCVQIISVLSLLGQRWRVCNVYGLSMVFIKKSLWTSCGVHHTTAG